MTPRVLDSRGVWYFEKIKIAAGESHLQVSLDDLCQLRTQNLPVVIIHKTKAIAVVGCTQIIPHAVGNFVFLQHGDYIAHPVFTPFNVGVADRTKFTAPQCFVGMLLGKLDGTFQRIANKADIHAVVFRVGIFFAEDNILVVAVAIDVAGIGHCAIVVKGIRLQNTSLMGELKGRIGVEGINNVFIFVNLQIG